MALATVPIYDTGSCPIHDTDYRSYLRHWLPVLFMTLVTGPIHDTGYQSYLRHWVPVLFTTLVTGLIYGTG